jgi:hypothetical protein
MEEGKAAEVLNGENSHCFTKQDVKEALQLAQKGEQQPQAVSASETTWFYFPLSYNSHYKATEMSITLRPISHSRNPFPHPQTRYTLCCGSTSNNKFKPQHQAVYNSRIRPIQWIFGDN